MGAHLVRHIVSKDEIFLTTVHHHRTLKVEFLVRILRIEAAFYDAITIKISLHY